MFDAPPPRVLFWSVEKSSDRQWAALARSSTALSKQVCRSQEQATLAVLRREVCAGIASTGCSCHYLSALHEPSQCLFNFPLLSTPPTSEVWPVAIGNMMCRRAVAE